MKKLAISVIMFCTIAFFAIPSLLNADVQQLLSPEKLHGWIENDNTDDLGRKVVILDIGIDLTNPPTFDNYVTYSTGHIPGAYYVSIFPLLNVVRTDGPTFIYSMVFDGARMDEFIQDYGIERDTAVVFTGNTMWTTTRAYWTFRYWGFKKSQLFILNGIAHDGDKSVWTDAGYELQTEVPPDPSPSTFSVSECPGNMDAVRASTEEFFKAAEGAIPNAVVVDARPVEDWNADVDNLSPFNINDIFAFRVKNSKWIEWSEYLVGGESGMHIFKSEQDIVTMLQDEGITEGMMPYSFCQGGGAATVNFFVFDALLDRPAKIHDGSSIELGKMGFFGDACSVTDKQCFSNDDCPAGETCEDFDRCSLTSMPCVTDSDCPGLAQTCEDSNRCSFITSMPCVTDSDCPVVPETCNDIGMPEDSPWRFDLEDYCSIINYNYPSRAYQPAIAVPYAPSANLVNEEDKSYYVPLPDLPVDVDIKPGSCPNPMRLKCNGVLPVAVLGTEEFNVMDIDLETVMITREGVTGGVPLMRHSYEDVGTPFEGELCECHNLRKDGHMDLSLKFKVSELVDGLNLNEVAGEDVPLTVTALTNDCVPIRGEDCILKLGDLNKECHSDLDCDADVDGTDAAMFKQEFGRRNCSMKNPCIADFQVDGDVDGTDASIFKSEFGMSLLW